MRVWVPNVVVGDITVAVTVTVVERAFRNEERRKDASIVGHIHTRLDLMLIDFGYMLTTDYSSTHLDNFEPIPTTLIELCALWLKKPPDGPPLRRLSDQLPPVIASAEHVANFLDDYRARYAFLIEKHPDLLNAIERLSEWVRVSRNQILGNPSITPSAEFEATMRHRVVTSMQQLLDEFSKLSPDPFRLTDDQRTHGAKIHERARSGAEAEEAASPADTDEPTSASPE
ncbi:MAG: hypothetical protein M3065_20580 [Actinomycetota bacterium]|nr:hypothetical protein [Actinomycetota bacterium]